jgi:hypothetical protein
MTRQKRRLIAEARAAGYRVKVAADGSAEFSRDGALVLVLEAAGTAYEVSYGRRVDRGLRADNAVRTVLGLARTYRPARERRIDRAGMVALIVREWCYADGRPLEEIDAAIMASDYEHHNRYDGIDRMYRLVERPRPLGATASRLAEFVARRAGSSGWARRTGDFRPVRAAGMRLAGRRAAEVPCHHLEPIGRPTADGFLFPI